MSVFLRFVAGLSRRTLLGVIAIGAVSGLLGASLIAVVGQMFGQISTLDDRAILTAALTMIVLAMLVLGLEVYAKRLLVRHAARCTNELRRALAAAVLRDPLRKTEAVGSARLMTAYSDDIRVITVALNQIPPFGVSVFVIIGCMVYLAWLSPGVFMILALVAVPALTVSVAIHKRSRALSAQTLTLRNRQVNLFRKIIEGIKELQLNRASSRRFLRDELGETVDRHERIYVRSMLMFSLMGAWTQFVYFLSITAVLLYMVATHQGPEIIAPYIVVALYMKSHVSQLLSAVPIWSQAGLVVAELDSQGYLSRDAALPSPTTASFLNSPNEAKVGLTAATHADAEADASIGDGRRCLELNGLVYTYRDERHGHTFAVGPLDLAFHPGELVFIVGHNGAGKSTLVKLLSGLYACDTGALRYNGIEVTDANREGFRQLFSVIFTMPFVFDELPLDELDQSAATDRQARVATYLERLGLQHKVTVEGNRLTTVDLSHGQRKRLALLSAYLEDRPILIFDEWAENQDPAFKEVFYKELLPELRSLGKLVIVVSHETHYFSVADRIVTLNAPDTASTIASDVAVQVPPSAAHTVRS